jgi:GST-like protein
MAGQNHHFAHYAPEPIPYAIDRYVNETGRLYAVLNKRLADREYIAGDYSIADMAAYPWVIPERQGQSLGEFPHLARWKSVIAARPAVVRAYALAGTINRQPAVTDAGRARYRSARQGHAALTPCGRSRGSPGAGPRGERTVAC